MAAVWKQNDHVKMFMAVMDWLPTQGGPSNARESPHCPPPNILPTNNYPMAKTHYCAH